MLGLILYLRRKKGKKPQTSPSVTGANECFKPRQDACKPYFLVQLHSVKVESEICADQQTQTITPERRPELELGNETDPDCKDACPETENIASREDCNPEARQDNDNWEVSGNASLYGEGNMCQSCPEIKPPETDHNIVNSDPELELTSTTGSYLDCQSNGDCHKSSATAYTADCEADGSTCQTIGCTWGISKSNWVSLKVGNNDTISISEVDGGAEVINNAVLTPTRESNEDTGIYGCSGDNFYTRTVGWESGKINTDGLLTDIMDECSDVVHNVTATGDRNSDKLEKCNSDNSGIDTVISVDKRNVLSQNDNTLNSNKVTINEDTVTQEQKARHCKVGEVNGHCALNAHELGNGRGGVNGGHFIPNSGKLGDLKEASGDSDTTDKATEPLYHTDYILDETLGT